MSLFICLRLPLLYAQGKVTEPLHTSVASAMNDEKEAYRSLIKMCACVGGDDLAMKQMKFPMNLLDSLDELHIDNKGNLGGENPK